MYGKYKQFTYLRNKHEPGQPCHLQQSQCCIVDLHSPKMLKKRVNLIQYFTPLYITNCNENFKTKLLEQRLKEKLTTFKFEIPIKCETKPETLSK